MHTPEIVDSVVITPTENRNVGGDSKVSAFVSCYGLGFRIAKFASGTTIVGHAGGIPGFGCDFRFLPEKDGLGVIAFTNR